MHQALKAVFFDFDDTLVATREIKWEHHKFVAKKFYNIDLLDEHIKPHWGKPFPELVCILYGTDNAKEALANNAQVRDNFPKILYDGTIPTLKRLRNEGIITGVVTATVRESFEHDLKTMGISEEYISYSQTAEDSIYHKPDPRVFDSLVEWLSSKQIKSNEVVYVGDGLHDMKAALGAGLNFIGVQTGLVAAAEFKQHGANSVESIAHLLSELKLFDQVA